jgi:quercetin dioxygenase-like cupin family protein
VEASVPKRCGPPLHQHPWDEAYYVLEGELDFQVGEKKMTLKAGDFLFAPGGTPHAFQGASDKPARALFFDVPAGSEAFFRECSREVKRIPEDLPKVGEIGARHNLRFIR